MHRSTQSYPDMELKKHEEEAGNGTPISHGNDHSAQSTAPKDFNRKPAAVLSGAVQWQEEGRSASPVEEEVQDGARSPCAGVSGDSILVGYHNLSKLNEVDLPSYVREHNTTLSFPEKLMLMLIHVERICNESGKKMDSASIGWVAYGRAFVIRDKARFSSKWLPVFFRQSKFSSFTRKLYRWGFRQVNLAGESPQLSRAMIFGNENFQRDDTSLLSKMRSITAAGRRRQQAAQSTRRVVTSNEPEPQMAGMSPELCQLLQLSGISKESVASAMLPSTQTSPVTQQQNHTPSNSLPLLGQPRMAEAGLGNLGFMGLPLTMAAGHVIPALKMAQAAQAQQQQIAQQNLTPLPHDSSLTREMLTISHNATHNATPPFSLASSFPSPPAHPQLNQLLSATANLPVDGNNHPSMGGSGNRLISIGSLPVSLASLQQQQQIQLELLRQYQHRTEEQQRMRLILEMLLRNANQQQR